MRWNIVKVEYDRMKKIIVLLFNNEMEKNLLVSSNFVQVEKEEKVACVCVCVYSKRERMEWNPFCDMFHCVSILI